MVELRSVITCPACAHSATETMPTDACLYVYDCKGCDHHMKPIKGKCCIYCSYGWSPARLVRKNAIFAPVRIMTDWAIRAPETDVSGSIRCPVNPQLCS